MNSVALLALTLGIIAVTITLQYLKLYEGLDRRMRQMHQTLQPPSSSALLSLQQELDLTDGQFNALLKDKSPQLLSLLKTVGSASIPSETTPTQTQTKTVPSKKEGKPKKASSTKPVQETFVGSMTYITASQRGIDSIRMTPYMYSEPSTVPPTRSYVADMESVSQRINGHKDNNLFDMNRSPAFLYPTSLGSFQERNRYFADTDQK